jgi:N-acetylneuraminate synthase
MSKFKIKNITIGDEYEPAIITELGINHNGKLDKAINLVDKAIEAGAIIIKHQTHIANAEMSEEAKKIFPPNADQSIFNVIQSRSLNEHDEKKLANYITGRKKIFISTPFSREAVIRLNKLNVPAFKIGSGEANNYHFIDFVTKFKKPIILSTGMNSLKSLENSITIILKKKIPLALMHCTNIYPTPYNLIRLNCITEMKKKYPQLVIGLSDHSGSIYPALGAIALGARIIEKHFTDNKKNKGPDISSSMNAKNLKELLNASKIVFYSRGGGKKPLFEEKKTINFAFPSVVALKNLIPGTILNKKNIYLKRPNTGDFGIKDLEKLYSKKIKKFTPINTQIKKKNLL